MLIMLIMLLVPVGLLMEIDGIGSSQGFDFSGQRRRPGHGAGKRQQQQGEECHGSCNQVPALQLTDLKSPAHASHALR